MDASFEEAGIRCSATDLGSISETVGNNMASCTTEL